jgi:predicted DNA repair protein MutK
MFLVGGGILMHGLPIGHAVEQWADNSNALGALLLPPLAAMGVGIVAGALALGAFEAGKTIKQRLTRGTTQQ